MTEKQEKILHTALTLFAEKGYDSTSTSKVAKLAGVSEGLIFRHFKNKEGLLHAIMQMGKERIYALYLPILKLSDPKEKLKSILELPFGIKSDQYHFWRLVYALKWQADSYDSSMSQPIKDALIQIFTELQYADPIAESELLLSIMDGIATSVLLRKPKNISNIKSTLLSKYDLK